jgi:hypothetical protein
MLGRTAAVFATAIALCLYHCPSLRCEHMSWPLKHPEVVGWSARQDSSSISNSNSVVPLSLSLLAV